MPDVHPDASTEPSSALRIARPCLTPECGAVFYVATILDAAHCPVCTPSRERYELSA
ncbi:hypothetical protein [Pseudolysinimonas kribbensis]|uniref:Transcriptional regulator n=1 Tax=Pseudolysinimonas kribbensis TaxID=433641 RepID=A0ABQ6KDP9_9MICO|nr:hypothetical protein [Pseudolysinimonas kribbensis]GMA96790.1 hypothetical protein GCM10025881_36140 [Pseudolysinimonas kribbensis]